MGPAVSSRRCPAFLRGAADESSLTNPITSPKETAARSAKVLCFGNQESSGCLIQEPAERFPRLQGICAEHLLYPRPNRTLPTVKHVFDDGEYLVAQQIAPPL